MLLFDQWYRKYGVRLPLHLLAPILTPTTALELPKQSVLHWPGTGSMDYGPTSDELIFKNIQRPIPVWYAPDLIVKDGNPRKIIQNFEDSIRQWHAKNRRYRRVRDYALGVRDQTTPLVCNYTYAFRTYMYVRSIYANYNRVMNVHRSMWLQIRERLDGPENHFVFYNLPKLLPGISDLKLFGKAAVEGRDPIPQQLLKRFGTIEATLLGELWKWAGTERSVSWWGGLTNAQLRKINLILQQNGQWCVLNLGILNELRQSTKQEAEAAELAQRASDIRTKGLRADQIRLFLVRGWISLSGLRSDAGATVDTEVVKPAELPAAAQPVAGPVTKIEPVLPSTAASLTSSTATVQSVETTSIPEEVDQLVPSEQAVLTIEADLERDLAALDALNLKQDSALSSGVGSSNLTLPPDEAVKTLCDQLADKGFMTAAEYRRFTTLAETYKTLPAPVGEGTLDEFIKVPPELLNISTSPKLRDNLNVPDKTMLKSRLIEFDERYIKEVMQRDVASMVLNLQQAGLCVTGYNKERVENIMGAYDTYLVKLNPIEGAQSNLRFKLPAIEDDGTYVSNGVRYRLRKQLTELPIRKVNAIQVALTSYYGKLFVTRSEKRVNDWGRWLRQQVMLKGLDDLDDSVTNLRVGNVFDPHLKVPRLFSTLAHDFIGFTTQGYDLYLDRKEALQHFKPEDLQRLEVEGSVVIGQDRHGAYLVVDANDALYKTVNGQLEPLGTFEQLLKLPLNKVPLDFAELKVMGKTIPLGLVLGHELGLDRLCQLLGVVPRRVPAGKRVELTDFEYALVFSDETLVFSREDRQAALILAGFNEYHRALRDYPASEFDREDVYLNVLETNGLGARYLRELELLYKLFVDPITKDLLIEMGEPIDFRGLLLRSAELLMLDYYPEKKERVRGYERMAGAVYSELVRAVRSQRARPGRSRLPIDLNPYAVWKNVAQDPSVSLVSEINPIQNLKEQEAVTYSGTGGRGPRSMTRETRVFRETDMGVISEATVDSGDVGVNMSLTADPKWRSLRGMSMPYDHNKPDLTSLFSTSALLSPASDRDDPRRTNFVSIQHGHGVACKGYVNLPVRTGYDEVLAERTGDLFATTARKPGVVKSVTSEGIVIEYEDGTTKGIELGRRYGEAAGLTIPHEVVTKLKAGDVFKVGDTIAYNTGFFSPSIDDPTQVVWKGAALVRVALLESNKTLEDASSISSKTAKLLTSWATKTVDVLVPFDYEVHRVVKVGTAVETEDILCVIEDAVTASAGLFDEESLDTLRTISAQTPHAKAKGTLERIEVFYHGDREDMSDTLKSLSAASDREIARRYRSKGKPGYTGSVDESFRVDGDPLQLDHAVLRFYITGEMPAGVGDKGVFANQMKTVFSEVYDRPVYSESGLEIDAIFGQKSIDDRIVTNPAVIGTTTTLLKVGFSKALARYRAATKASN